MHSTDVFVIGGGPAGLAVALAARQKGFRVALADGARPPIDKACGEGLMPDGLAALRRLGISLPGNLGFPFRGIRFLEGGVSVEADFPSGRALGIRRTVLHGIMAQQAAVAGVDLLWGKPVEGISDEGVSVAGRNVPCRWIIGADGSNSQVRRWAGLDACLRDERRYGFRQHYRIAPWTGFMEVYWGPDSQIYVTPVGSSELCVAVISRNSHFRLADAFADFPELASRLKAAVPFTAERGSITGTHKLRRVYSGRVALVGDASGTVDAIGGEGLCLAFRQAMALADILESGDLAAYQARHRSIMRRPSCMVHLMLAIGSRAHIRRPALRFLAGQPRIFAGMLAMHDGGS